MSEQINKTKPTFEETLEWLQTTKYSGPIGVTALFRVKDKHRENFIALLKDYNALCFKRKRLHRFRF